MGFYFCYKMFTQEVIDVNLLKVKKDPSIKRTDVETSLRREKTLFEGLTPHCNNIKKLPRINTNQVKNLFYDPMVMEQALCAIDKKILSNSAIAMEKIYLHSANISVITEDETKATMKVKLDGDSDDMMVLKAPKKTTDVDLIHEILVGLCGLNNLRKFIPNFAYIYGGFKCNTPLIGENKVTICPTEGSSVHYAIYENINPSITLTQFIKTCSIREFLNIYVQICFALLKAEAICEFTHYDLHTDNVLIRKLNRDMTIRYGKYSYLKTSNVATIIDFEFAHIRLSDGSHLGRKGYEHFFVDSQDSHTLGDAYKLLMFCGYELRTHSKNAPLMKLLNYLFRFFNKTESYIECLDKNRNNYYVIPKISQSPKLQDFLLYILDGEYYKTIDLFLYEEQPSDYKLQEDNVIESLIDYEDYPNVDISNERKQELLKNHKDKIQSVRQEISKEKNDIRRDTLIKYAEFLEKILKKYE